MSQQNLLPDRPTLLLVPAWYSDQAREEIVLPLAPAMYEVTPPAQPSAAWKVTCVKDGSVVYQGIGPVEVARSRAPF